MSANTLHAGGPQAHRRGGAAFARSLGRLQRRERSSIAGAAAASLPTRHNPRTRFPRLSWSRLTHMQQRRCTRGTTPVLPLLPSLRHRPIVATHRVTDHSPRTMSIVERGSARLQRRRSGPPCRAGAGPRCGRTSPPARGALLSRFGDDLAALGGAVSRLARGPSDCARPSRSRGIPACSLSV